MTVQVANEATVMREVAQVLLKHLAPDKVARFWAAWQVGQGDYLAWRDAQFADETVDSLYEAIVQFQTTTSQTD
jgi:hypothetical protein